MLNRLKLDTLVGIIGVGIFLSFTFLSDTVATSTLQIDYDFIVYGAIGIVVFTLLVDYLKLKSNLWLLDTVLFYYYFIRAFSQNYSLLDYDYHEYGIDNNILWTINVMLASTILVLVLASALTFIKHYDKPNYKGRTTLGNKETK